MKFSKQMRLVYTAALLDGEGCFFIRHNYSYGNTLSISVQCSMTDTLPLKRLNRWWGGHFTGPYSKNNAKPIYYWALNDRLSVIHLIQVIYPFMSKRRKKKIKELLRCHKNNPLKRRAFAEHGTLTMYSKYKCRCIRCRSIYSDYTKQRYRLKML